MIAEGIASWPQRRPAAWAAGLAAASVACGACAGWLAVAMPDVVQLQLRWSPGLVMAGLAGALALVAMAARPLLGIALLLALAFSNASEVLVREHGMPSALQLLVPVLLAVLAATPQRPAPLRPTGGLRPDRAFLACSVAYLAVQLLSTTWAWNRPLADETVIDTLKAFVLAVVIGWAIPDIAALVASAWVLTGTGAALAALSSWQVLTDRWEQSFAGFARVKQAHIAGTDLGPRATGPLADPNFYAQALLPLVPLAIALALSSRSRAARAVAWVLGGIAALGIVTTYSRGGALAMFLAVGLFAWSERARIRLPHAAAAALLAVLVASLVPADLFVRRLETLSVLLPGAGEQVERHDSSVTKRRVLMAAAAAMALDNPVRGVGAGNYGEHFESYADRVGALARVYHDPGERAFPHSLYLEVAAETGLLGLVALAGVLGSAVLAAGAARRRLAAAGDERGALLARALLLGLVAVLVSSLILHGDYPRYPWLVFGLAVAAWRCSARAPAGSTAA